jgi:hypothetical protein
VGGVEVDRCGVINEAFQRAVMPAPQVEFPTASMMASNPNPSVGEEYRKPNLDIVVGEDARSMGPVGGQNPARGYGGHVEGAPAAGDPPHDIVGAWLF